MEFFSAFGRWCDGPAFWNGTFGGGGHGWTGWMPFHFGGIVQLVVIGLIIYFTVRIFRSPITNNGPDSPEAILKRRYAAGEIDEQTYGAMKNNLHND